MPADSNAESLAKQSTFVFKGTVRKLKASTMPALAVDSRTAIVLVDEVLQAPTAFSNLAGREITVQVGGRKKIAVGDRAVFYANSWRFGESIAVRAIDFLPEEKVSPGPTRAAFVTASPHGLTPVRSSAAEVLAQRQLQQHIDAADVVVTGRVMAVRAPAETSPSLTTRALGPGSAGPSTEPPRKISEHDPLWQEAVVEVTGTEKGEGTGKQIVVRFPSSRDVRWYKAPKFTPGQEGVFMLRKSKAEPSASTRALATRSAMGAGAAEVFSAEHPADFQPIHLAESIRTLIKPSEKRAPKAPAAATRKVRRRRG